MAVTSATLALSLRYYFLHRPEFQYGLYLFLSRPASLLSNFRGHVSYIFYHVLRASQKFARYDCLHTHLFVFREDAWTHHFPRIYPALHVIHLVMSAIGQILTILTRNIDGGSGQDGEMVWQRGLWMAKNRVQYQWTTSSNIYKRESQRTNLAKFDNSWIEGWSFQSHVWRSEDNHPGNTEIAEIFRLDLAFNRRPLCDVLDSTFCDCATECSMHAVLTTDCFCVCIKCSFKFSMPSHAVIILVSVAFISCVWCKPGY